MEATNSVLMKHVAPGLGVIVACMLFASPVAAVRSARQSRQLGPLNPLPFCAMLANCVAWLVYALLTSDPYVLASNMPGVLMSLWLTLTTFGLADEPLRHLMLMGVLGFATVLMAAGVTVSFFHLDHTAKVSVWGTVTVLILVLFYSAPLSVLADVFRTRSSAALYLPFAVMNCVNGVLWTAYGAAVADAVIWGPNAVGLLFGGLQTVLCVIYPNVPPPSSDRNKAATSPHVEDSEMGRLYDVSARS